MTTAFAAPGPITGGTETTPAQAVITKTLQMPDGTATPAETFTFTLARKSVDGVAYNATTNPMPAITNKTVAFAATDVGTTASSIKTVSKETASLFTGIVWPHAGVYTYTVTETAGSTAGMTYSSGSYDISVYVANGTSSLYIAAIGTTVVAVDHTGQTIGDKTDPTTSTTISGASSAMVFTNTYIQTPTVVNPTLGDALSVSKTVVGTYGDQSKYFGFTVSLTKAAFVSGTPTYKVYVMNASNAVVTSTDNYATLQPADTYGVYINVTAGTPITINLKHGQRLAFMGLPVGTTYSVTEAGTPDYTPSASVVVNGGVPAVTNGTVSTALSIGSPTAIIIGANTNSAAYTNTYKTVAPTGISLNNLPFIMMIGLAVIALAVFLIVKSRKRAVYGSKH